MASVIKSLEKRLDVIKQAIVDENIPNPEDCVTRFMEVVEEAMQTGRRVPRKPAPEGGISISDAARKYNIATSTITQWMQAGRVEVLRKDANWTYIKETDIKELAGVHHSSGGRGKRAISKYIAKKQEN